MKTKALMTLAFLLGICALGNSQSTKSGVYKTYEDFTNQKMMYAIDCDTEKHKIKLNEFLSKDHITVVHDKQPHDLKKNEIFGYQDCDGAAYRFVGDSHYTILNPTEKILLYKHTMANHKTQTVHYYFSFAGRAEVEKLTLNNLKKAFPENHKFHNALDAAFKTDDELVGYDTFHKIYEVNSVYASNK
jgi:hypothetical protein